MPTSPLLGTELMVESQGSAHFVFNEMVYIHEACHRLLDTGLATPPGSPAEGDAHLVIATATGAWAGYEGYIAVYMNSAWVFVTPYIGMLVLVLSTSSLYRFAASSTLVKVNFAGSVVDMGTGNGTQTINTASGSLFKLVADGNVTLAFSGTPNDMDRFEFRFEQSSGGHTLTMPANVRLGTRVTSSDLSGIDTSAGAVAYLMFQYHAGDAKYDLIAFNDAFI